MNKNSFEFNQFQFSYQLAKRLRQASPIFNNPIFKNVHDIQGKLSNSYKLFNTRGFDDILKNQVALKRTLKLFNPTPHNNPSRYIQKIIPNFYKFNALQNFKGITPYFNYIQTTRSQINQLSKINYESFQQSFIRAQHDIGIPGDDYTRKQLNNNQSLQNHIITLPKKKLNLIIHKASNEAAIKASEITRSKDKKNFNNLQNYKNTTINYNNTSSTNWWTIVLSIILSINNIDESCHTINDVINLINHSNEIISTIMKIMHGIGL